MKQAVIATLVTFLAAHAYAQTPGRGGSSSGGKKESSKPVDTACELKTIKKIKYDEKCARYIDPEEESKALDKDGKCVKCQSKPEEREVCEKIYYQCPKCFSTDKKAGACANKACKDTKREKHVDFARIGFKCPGNCGMMAYEKGKKCDNKECTGYKKDFVKT